MDAVYHYGATRMLILSRKQGEAIAAGDVIIHVLSVGRRVVKLGLEAPGEIRIRRTELGAMPSTPPTMEGNHEPSD